MDNVTRELATVKRDVAEIKRQLQSLPVRRPIGGGSGLPAPGETYQVLQIIDADQNIDWDWVRASLDDDVTDP